MDYRAKHEISFNKPLAPTMAIITNHVEIRFLQQWMRYPFEHENRLQVIHIPVSLTFEHTLLPVKSRSIIPPKTYPKTFNPFFISFRFLFIQSSVSATQSIFILVAEVLRLVASVIFMLNEVGNRTIHCPLAYRTVFGVDQFTHELHHRIGIRLEGLLPSAYGLSPGLHGDRTRHAG